MSPHDHLHDLIQPECLDPVAYALMPGTRSAELIARIRRLAHEQTRNGEPTELAVEALKLCSIHEEFASSVLRMERALHSAMKEEERAG